MSSDDETVQIQEELGGSIAFNNQPLFEDDKQRDIIENKFNFDDQDLDTFGDKILM